jgi:hypothetical protein
LKISAWLDQVALHIQTPVVMPQKTNRTDTNGPTPGTRAPFGKAFEGKECSKKNL